MSLYELQFFVPKNTQNAYTDKIIDEIKETKESLAIVKSMKYYPSPHKKKATHSKKETYS